MNANEQLLEATKNAVRRTLTMLQTQHPQESLAGYALLTDDNLTTLSSMAITKEALAAGSEDLLFSPTDWPYESESTSFDSAREKLMQLGMTGDARSDVELAFGTLVQALAETRAEGVVGSEAFFTALSTDPSPQLEALENASVRRLNETSIVQAHERFLARWAR